MKRLAILAGLSLITLITSCDSGDNDSGPCVITVSNSQPGLTADGRIRSHKNCSTYQAIRNVRKDSNGTDISIDYMVHTPSGSASALVVLIAGGDGDARIEGANGVGQAVTRSSGNFLVRSAHLFAAQGYKVVTLDRPSDYSTVASNSEYDTYRTSSKHAVDISTIVNKENTDNLPVIIAGTSRGAISAVSQSKLADAISLSSPVTTGGGTPVDEAGTVKPSSVSIPVHIMWHDSDGCSVSTPTESTALVLDFNPAATSNALNGGFNADDAVDPCNANTFHGFYGMETTAVDATAMWINSQNFSTSKPVANADALDYTNATSVGVDLSGLVAATNGGTLTISLPKTTTSLGGTVSLSGNTLTYESNGISGSIDSFVYVVTETGGGSNHNVLTVTIP